MQNDYLYIDFPTYDKHFLEALKAVNPTDYHVIFYEKTDKSIDIYFSWNAFKIKTSITIDEIGKMYEGHTLNDADVVLSNLDDEPIIKKFYVDYLLNRGVPLSEEM
jgi:hypothetical protein